MFLMASRGEGVARWLMVETGARGRRKAKGGRVTAERRSADGLRRKADGGVSELRMCSYLAGLHLWTMEEFVRREEGGRSPLLRGCAFVWLLCFGW